MAKQGVGAEIRSELVHGAATELAKFLRNRYPELSSKLAQSGLLKLLLRAGSIGIRTALPDSPIGEDLKTAVTEFLSEFAEGSDTNLHTQSSPSQQRVSVRDFSVPSPVAPREAVLSLFADEDEKQAFDGIVRWLGQLVSKDRKSAEEALAWLNKLTKIELIAFAALDDRAKDNLWLAHSDDEEGFTEKLLKILKDGAEKTGACAKALGQGVKLVGGYVAREAREGGEVLSAEMERRRYLSELRIAELERELAIKRDKVAAGSSPQSLIQFWRL